MSDSLNKYCSEAKDFKDVKDAMNKIQKLRAQMKNKCADRNFGLRNGTGCDKLGTFFGGIRQHVVQTSWTV